MDSKMEWNGVVLGIQPRIRLSRSFDERAHSYLGYVLRIRGTLAGQQREFLVALAARGRSRATLRAGLFSRTGVGNPRRFPESPAVARLGTEENSALSLAPDFYHGLLGKATQEKHRFHAGDQVEGRGERVADSRQETADVYKASGLKILARGLHDGDGPPFLGVPPALDVYRERGHRRLAARTYAAKCSTCKWGCEMPVEIIVDHWNPSQKRYRRETFCYGPKSCSFYAAGPTRKVPGRKGMIWEEEDWVDEDATGHRGPDE